MTPCNSLDLLPGATMPATELYRRYSERIADPEAICHYTEAGTTVPEWNPCGSARSGAYRRGLARLFNDLGLEPPENLP